METNSLNSPSFKHTCKTYICHARKHLCAFGTSCTCVYINCGTMNEEKSARMQYITSVKTRYWLGCRSHFIFNPSLCKRGYIAFIMTKECEVFFTLFPSRFVFVSSNTSGCAVEKIPRGDGQRNGCRESGDNDDAGDSSHSMLIVPRAFMGYLYIYRGAIGARWEICQMRKNKDLQSDKYIVHFPSFQNYSI